MVNTEPAQLAPAASRAIAPLIGASEDALIAPLASVNLSCLEGLERARLRWPHPRHKSIFLPQLCNYQLTLCTRKRGNPLRRSATNTIDWGRLLRTWHSCSRAGSLHSCSRSISQLFEWITWRSKFTGGGDVNWSSCVQRGWTYYKSQSTGLDFYLLIFEKLTLTVLMSTWR